MGAKQDFNDGGSRLIRAGTVTVTGTGAGTKTRTENDAGTWTVLSGTAVAHQGSKCSRKANRFLFNGCKTRH